MVKGIRHCTGWRSTKPRKCTHFAPGQCPATKMSRRGGCTIHKM